MDILLKYDHQRSGEKLKFYDAYAEDLRKLWHTRTG